MTPLERGIKEVKQQVAAFQSMLDDSKIPNVHPEIRNTRSLAEERLACWSAVLAVLEHPHSVDVEETDACIFFAELIAVIPNDMCQEDKGDNIVAEIRKVYPKGLRVVNDFKEKL